MINIIYWDDPIRKRGLFSTYEISLLQDSLSSVIGFLEAGKSQEALLLARETIEIINKGSNTIENSIYSIEKNNEEGNKKL